MKKTFPDRPEFKPKTGLSHVTQYKQFREAELKWFESLLAHPHVQAVMHIPSTEPIFVLRSQDIEAPATVDFWLHVSQRTIDHKKFDAAARDYQAMLEWQQANPDKVKIPD